MVSIALPKRIEEKLRKRAEETETLPEELTVDLIVKSLNEEIDPEELVEHYQTLNEKYLAAAKELLSKGDPDSKFGKIMGSYFINS